MFNLENIYNQISELQEKYNDLKIIEENSKEIILKGKIHINISACNYTLNNYYLIKIVIPLNSMNLPFIIDEGNYIDKNYIHRYLDGRLCLETDTIMQIKFLDGMTLSTWIEEFVEQYYFSYEFYSRYNYYPFGERPHGIDGIINTYQELFCESDLLKTCDLMLFVASKNYRGHITCPCGSGKKLRNCHGKYLMSLMSNKNKKNIVKSDLLYIMEVLKNEQQRRNNKNSK